MYRQVIGCNAGIFMADRLINVVKELNIYVCIKNITG